MHGRANPLPKAGWRLRVFRVVAVVTSTTTAGCRAMVDHVPDGQPLFFHIYSNIYPKAANTTQVYGPNISEASILQWALLNSLLLGGCVFFVLIFHIFFEMIVIPADVHIQSSLVKAPIHGTAASQFNMNFFFEVDVIFADQILVVPMQVRY